MRTMLRGKFTLLFLTFAVATLIFPAIAFAQDAATSTAAPTTSTAAPTIQSDKDDYQPGELVTLTGSDWQPGDSVHIFVNDDEGQSWSHNSDPDPVADDSGAFTYEFNLPEQFVAMYNVTATGVESGTAKTTFTDAVAFGGCPAGSPISSPINVTTTNDEYNTTPNSTCSLREAIRAASLDPGADTINVPAGTYTLFRNGSDNTTSGIDQKDLDITNGPVT